MPAEIPDALKPAVEEIVAARIKEHNAGEWAKGINGVVKKHTDAIDQLTEQITRLRISIDHSNETATERAVATAEKLGIPMLSPNRRQTLTEVLDQAEEDKVIKKRADKREGLLHNRWVQITLAVALVYQLLGITAGLYNAFFGAAHPLRIWP